MPLDALKPPVFVIGNPRSGTTLLRLMLTCHGNIVIPPECGFAAWLYPRFKDWRDDRGREWRRAFVRDLFECRKIETWRLDRGGVCAFLDEHVPSCFPEAVSLVYEFYGRGLGRTFARWGDKNNFYTGHIALLDTMFPQARFVHIVRDGRNVACSYRRLNNRDMDSPYAPRLPYAVADIAQEWLKNLEKVRAAFSAMSRTRVYELRLEDLVEEPEKQLERLCAFLGEPFDPGMLDYHRKNKEDELEPATFLQWKEKTLKPPLREGRNEYASELTRGQVAEFEAAAGKMLAEYGYLDGRSGS